MSARQWLLLALLSVLWGGAFFFVEVALVDLPPSTIVFARLAIAAVALLAVVRLAGLALPRGWRAWLPFALLGLVNNALPFSLITWGQQSITGGLAAILNATAPLFTVLLAHVATDDERLTPGKLAGVLLGLAGVAVLVGPDALAGLGDAVLAQLAVLVAALCYAVAGLLGKRLRAHPPPVTATAMVTCSALLMLPVAAWLDRPWLLPVPGPEAVGAVLGLALLSTVLAYLIFYRLLAGAGATNALLVTFLIPVSALLLGAGLLDEPVDAPQLAGMGLIGLGLVAVDGRAWRYLRGLRGP